MLGLLIGLAVLLVSNGLIVWSVTRRGHYLVNLNTGESEWIPPKVQR
jgi:hypothetical protein